MIESLSFHPKKVGNNLWNMIFVGIIYASLSVLLVKLFFSSDPVLVKYSGILVVTFCVMFSLPYLYAIIRKEEKEDEDISGLFNVWKTHKDAIYAFMFLFLGFIIAFSFWFILLGDSNLFNAQLETYCAINSPSEINSCLNLYGPSGREVLSTGHATKGARFLSIFENNVYVMIFTLLFSLIFGAGAIFILAWNASVISGAIGIFTEYTIHEIPLGFLRYMIHGFPELAAYFVAALAGGIFGVGAIRNGIKNKKFLHVSENAIILIFASLIMLVFAALLEVFLTPILF